jgi:UDP-N-acetylmuramoylalanine--D-glutamate ligase
VVGLARSGEAIAEVLARRGARVVGVDAGGGAPLVAAARRLSAAGVEVHLNAADPALLADAVTVVKSPGVPSEVPLLVAARARGLPVVGELELAWRLLPNPFIAVTGTNGKTTTTEWIGHIHRAAQRPVAVAGNVGTALSSLVGQLAPETAIVCEASSFQLEDTVAFAPEVAVLLNLTPDHLDRHGTFAAYREAKLRIFSNQAPDQVAVLPDGFDHTPRARTVRFGDPAALPTERISLPGPHNRQNAMAAAAAARAAGIPEAAIREGLETFRGVAHRLELVAEHDGVRYVNDSKATNVDATLTALHAFAGRIHLIAGGDGKGQDFSPLAAAAGERCAAVYLIGEAAEAIALALTDAGVLVHRCGELARAVALAGRSAGQGDVVLLSPACASYDQFQNFEERGDAFRRLVGQ